MICTVRNSILYHRGVVDKALYFTLIVVAVALMIGNDVRGRAAPLAPRQHCGACRIVDHIVARGIVNKTLYLPRYQQSTAQGTMVDPSLVFDAVGQC